ncbi:hypothetical protein NOR_08281 [Metarhizium rileyi]|uniref:Uncharacterized protein n=1 Tax=Metarhizium rileyi (strain RCEF 4871) TaxID=1649241 RepID=A0A166WII3_METRR|nr:hypothetical protein NOR_08281 [Metarhizium rileyi RCEF 4871]
MNKDEDLIAALELAPIMPVLSTTPPDNISSLFPPSPPATDKRVKSTDANDESDCLLPVQFQEHKTLCERTSSPPAFAHFTIDRKEYRTLEAKIARVFKRFDYEPRRNRLTIRMPSPIHSYVASFFQQEVSTELNNALTNCTNEAKSIAKKIISVQDCRVYLKETGDDNGPTKREPDIQFQYSDTTYPSVIGEVSYSKDGKHLRALAQDYILYSDGEVKLVIGLDLNYRNEPSTVSLWRPKFTEIEDGLELGISEEVKQVPFCSSNGQALNSDRLLEIDLRDFAPDEVSKTWPDITLNIAFSRLAQLAQDAQEWQKRKETGGSDDKAKPKRVIRKRRLSSSPVEDLRSEDEAYYFQMEAADASRRDASDGDYRPSVAERRGQSSVDMLSRSAKEEELRPYQSSLNSLPSIDNSGENQREHDHFTYPLVVTRGTSL